MGIFFLILSLIDIAQYGYWLMGYGPSDYSGLFILECSLGPWECN